MDVSQTLARVLHRASIDELSEHTSISRRSLYRYRIGDIDPPLRRAAAIASALGYELVIRPRGRSAAASNPPPQIYDSAPQSQIPGGSGAGGDRPPIYDSASQSQIPGGGVAVETVPDRRLAEVLAVLADEWEAVDDRAQEALLIRFWHAYPDLRERAAARSGRRLARLAGGVGAG